MDARLTSMFALLACLRNALVPNPVRAVDADGRRFASDTVDAQGGVARAGCAGGVTGRPQGNAKVLYAPVNYQCGARAREGQPRRALGERGLNGTNEGMHTTPASRGR